MKIFKKIVKLTESWEFESVSRAYQIDECLQLKTSSSNIQIVIQHGEFESWLHLISALFENSAWKNTKKSDKWSKICWYGKLFLASSMNLNKDQQTSNNLVCHDFPLLYDFKVNYANFLWW